MAPKQSNESDSKSPLSKRSICVTSADGQTGHLIAELLLTDGNFTGNYAQLCCHAIDTDACKDLEELGARVEPYTPGDAAALEKGFAQIDTVLIIPPATENKLELTKELVDACKKAKNVVNIVLLSSAGADYAERDQQPRLREFIDIEHLVLTAKSDTSTEDTGHSPCIIRAGFYAENLLLYAKQAQSQGKLPLPIQSGGKFAPVSLGDVALLAAKILTSEGPHGLGDDVRGQMITMTGGLMVAPEELVTAASEALGAKLEFEAVSAAEAKKILAQTDIDPAEAAYLLEYYSLVDAGKMNYIATSAYKQITGQDVTLLPDFFKTYKDEFAPSAAKKRKTG